MNSNVLDVTLAVVSTALVLTGCGTSAPPARQYASGERPCVESTQALGVVTLSQLRVGSFAPDTDGSVRAALKQAKVVLRDRAGESAYYSAASYNAAADAAYATIDPLVDAYDHFDVTNTAPWFAAEEAFVGAHLALEHECTSGLPSR